MDWIVPYILGLVTLPVIAAVVTLVRWAIGRDWGGGGCTICDHAKSWEHGEVTNLRFWLNGKAHAWFWARLPAHRQAAGDRWREANAKGYQTRQWSDRYMR